MRINRLRAGLIVRLAAAAFLSALAVVMLYAALFRRADVTANYAELFNRVFQCTLTGLVSVLVTFALEQATRRRRAREALVLVKSASHHIERLECHTDNPAALARNWEEFSAGPTPTRLETIQTIMLEMVGQDRGTAVLAEKALRVRDYCADRRSVIEIANLLSEIEMELMERI
jgi:hypothetical protein